MQYKRLLVSCIIILGLLGTFVFSRYLDTLQTAQKKSTTNKTSAADSIQDLSSSIYSCVSDGGKCDIAQNVYACTLGGGSCTGSSQCCTGSCSSCTFVGGLEICQGSGSCSNTGCSPTLREATGETVSGTGTSRTFTFGFAAGSPRGSGIYIDDLSNGWAGNINGSCSGVSNNPGDICTGLPGTSATSQTAGPFTVIAGHTYRWWVRLKDSCGNLGPFSYNTFSVPAAPAPLGCPTGLGYTCGAGGTSVTIRWNALSGAATYKVNMNRSPQNDWAGPGDYAINPVSGTSRATTIAAGTTYYWDVQGARSGEAQPYAGCRTFSTLVCPAAVPTPRPRPTPTPNCGSATITNITATGGSNSITQRWSAPTNCGTFHVAMTPGNNFQYDPGVNIPATTQSFTWTHGTTYNGYVFRCDGVTQYRFHTSYWSGPGVPSWKGSPTATCGTPPVRPTSTPTPRPRPTLTTRPRPTITPRPTATPRIRPTATPRVRPTATPRTRPTATPRTRPTATPRIRATATPRPRVRPTPRPTARPTVRPTAAPTPTATTFTITGAVFVDANNNRVLDNGETTLQSRPTITSSNGTVATTNNGTFTVTNVTAGNRTIRYTSLPTGYQMIYPLNGPPPSFSLRVGPGCTVDTTTGALCDSNGNIQDLNFAISNTSPWIQSIGLNMRFDNGYDNSIPASPACTDAFGSIAGSSTTPGILFTGDSSPRFGNGQASSTRWVVGGAAYSEVYRRPRGQLLSSYAALLSTLRKAGANIVNIQTINGCSSLANCTLPANLQTIGSVFQANGNLNLNTHSFAPNSNAIFLINGTLTIRGPLQVPIGSTALFSTSQDIRINQSVGYAPSCNAGTNVVQGVFSADNDFVVQGINNCATGSDLMVRIDGSVIVNAAGNGGVFQNNRDLCANNANYPTVIFSERPDFILNIPDALRTKRLLYQEVAP